MNVFYDSMNRFIDNMVPVSGQSDPVDTANPSDPVFQNNPSNDTLGKDSLSDHQQKDTSKLIDSLPSLEIDSSVNMQIDTGVGKIEEPSGPDTSSFHKTRIDTVERQVADSLQNKSGSKPAASPTQEQVPSIQTQKPVYKPPSPDDIPYLLSDEELVKIKHNNIAHNFIEEIRQTPFLKKHARVFIQDNAVNSSQGKAYKSYLQEEPKSLPVQKDHFFTGTSIFSVIMVSFILISVSKAIFGKYFQNIMRAVYNYSLSSKLFRDKNVRLTRVSFLLNIVFAINLSCFITYALHSSYINIFPQNLSGSILLYFGAIIFLYAIKAIICKIIGYLFKIRKACNEYIHNFYLMNKNMGLLLFPIILVIPFAPTEYSSVILYAGIAIIAYFFLLRYVRGLQIIFQYNLSLFYMFLYFCTLEVFPLFLIYKGFLFAVNI